jgi:hypothetical protein
MHAQARVDGVQRCFIHDAGTSAALHLTKMLLQLSCAAELAMQPAPLGLHSTLLDSRSPHPACLLQVQQQQQVRASS